MNKKIFVIGSLVSAIALQVSAGVEDPIKVIRGLNGRTGKITALSQRMGEDYERTFLGTPCTIKVTDQAEYYGGEQRYYVNVGLTSPKRPYAGENDFAFTMSRDFIGRSRDGSVIVVKNNDSQHVAFRGCGEGFMHMGRGPKTFEQTLILKPNTVEYSRTYTCKPKNDAKGVVEGGPFTEKIVCQF